MDFGYRRKMIVRLFRYIRGFIRANFIAGMFIAVPFAITIAFLLWLWSIIEEPLARFFKIASLPKGLPWSRLFTAITNSKYDDLFIPLVSLFILLLAVLVLGIITRSIIGRLALAGVENAVSRMPLVGMIYNSLKQMGEAFVTAEGASKFQRVVAVQFPYKGSWAIGFVTGKAASILPKLPPLSEGAAQTKVEYLSVLVPSTPFPTTSFMLIVPEHETIQLDMPVRDALKVVISGGVISPGDSHRRPKEQLA